MLCQEQYGLIPCPTLLSTLTPSRDFWRMSTGTSFAVGHARNWMLTCLVCFAIHSCKEKYIRAQTLQVSS
ncbi:hypothetical protein QYF36_004986 [Acer negundo]|nr:hypothetical protein QYF36_004986 [Acer negundo]